MRSNPFPADHGTTENVLLAEGPNALLQGLQRKRRIIAELIEGHMPLLQAASQFEAAQQASSACFERVTGIPSATDSESICRTVIGWVHLVLSDRPEQAERVSQQLEKELQGYLQQYGNVNLSAHC